jgi:myxalamid-type polyketide synthase MxaB
VPEPIAIVGMGCRLPAAPSLSAYWQLLLQGQDAIREVPHDRWSLEEFYDADPNQAGKHYCRQGGFLDQVDQFEPEFFGIAPREAAYIDPQQRLLLEVMWEALEDAAIVPQHLSGSKTGVFVGASTLDYGQLLLQQDDRIGPYTTTGLASTMLANRISYLFNFQGPSLSVDTACSSSLVAVQLACQSLWRGESSLALAGGVNVMVTPSLTIGFSKLTALSPDGRCKAFDAQANGFVRSEGAGAVVLKLLSRALAEGDPIYGLIRGGAINQDGRTNGLTAPNREAQEQVLREAYRQARVPLTQVSYIEAHGTGTLLGDPIEAKALGNVFTDSHRDRPPIRMGSVKSNLGHTEAAAGIASLIKVALCLKHQTWVPSLHYHQPNPYIPFAQLPLQVQTETQPWAGFSDHAIAGVSSFGFGGTNAHLVLQAPPPNPGGDPALDRPCHLLTLSARSELALHALVDDYRNRLVTLSESDLANLCYTANAGRTRFNHRLATLVTSLKDLQQSLSTFAGGGKPGSDPFLKTVLPGPGQEPPLVWLFTGQGSQYPGMGQHLYRTQPIFRMALDRCDQILRTYLDRPLLAVLYSEAPEDGLIHQTSYTQPALFALEYALAQLWLSWGVRPAAVLGHSVGEYVAACIAGVFSLEDGLRLIARRGQLMQSLPAHGLMAAVMADADQVAQVITLVGENQVAIATLNSPQNTVIAGPQDAVDRLLEEFARRQIACTPLAVSHAFHSPQMDPILKVFEHGAGQVSFQPPRIPLVSNLTGTFLTAGEIPDAAYWRRHARQPVRFAEGVAALYAEGYTHFLEIGPQPVLSRLGQQCLPQTTDCRWFPSLARQRPDWSVLGQSLMDLCLEGVVIDWQGFDQPYQRQKLALPTYPFQRRSYWIDWDRAFAPSLQTGAVPVADRSQNLLGRRLYSAALDNHRVVFEGQLQAQPGHYLNDHCVFDHRVVPASAWLELALGAGVTLFAADQVWVEDFVLEQGLILDRAPVVVQTLVQLQADGTARVELFSASTAEGGVTEAPIWVRHATGRLRPGQPTSINPPLSAPTEGQALAVNAFYSQLQARGLQYGPAFQTLRQVFHTETAAWGQVTLGATAAAAGDYSLHPALLDGCFQLVGALLQDPARQAIYLPIGVNQLRLFKPGQSRVMGWVQRLVPHGQNGELLSADLQLFTEEGQRVAEVEGLLLRRTSPDRLLHQLEPDVSQYTYTLSWKTQPTPTAPADLTGNWLVLVEEPAIATAIQAALTQAGGRCIQVSIGPSYAMVSPEHYRVNPEDAEGFHPLFRALADQPLRGILHLWSLEAPTEPLPIDLEASQRLVCGSTLHLLQELIAYRPTPRLWLITQHAQAVVPGDIPVVTASSLWGLGRVIALEHPELRCGRVDLPSSQDWSALVPLLIQELVTSGEDQVAYRQEARYVARLERWIPTPGPNLGAATPVRLQSAGTGILTDLSLMPMVRQAPASGQVEIRVQATGLNFRDVLNALGMLQSYMAELGLENGDIPFGGECSGEVVAVGAGVTELQVGDRVIAALAIGSLGSYVTVPASLVVLQPASLSFEEAATLSTAFLTAYYGLCHLAQLQPGERVLIHAAAGGVGQAAVQIAQWRGAEVYATASPAKWEVLQAMGVKGVMNSRTLDFGEELLALTEGQGVDVVLNSLTGEFIAKSLAVLATGGRFVEIGKIGIWTPAQLAAERPDVAYFPFDLLEVAQADPELMTSLLQAIMAQFEVGRFRPLPYRAFPLEQVVEGFRYMAQAKHVGKVVITQTEPGPMASGPANISDDGTYLVTGGLGGLGLRVAHWLVRQGGRHLVLTSRRQADDQARAAIAALEADGARVGVIQADVAIAGDVQALVAHIQHSWPPLRGIIHGAGVLQDGLLRGQSWEQFWSVMAPKVQGSWNLHCHTQDLPLDFFLSFSSLAALLGSPGQGNYAAANGFMDTLAHYRRGLGLPGLSVNWGPWAEAGMAAQLSAQDQARLVNQGIQPLAIAQGLGALAALLGSPANSRPAQVGVMVITWVTFLKQFSASDRIPLLAEFYDTQAPGVPPTPQSSALVEQLACLAVEDRRQRLQDYLRSEIAQVLGLSNPGDIELRQRLFDLGLDSLMAVELKNRLEQILGQTIPTTLLFDYPTIEALVEYFLEDLLIFRESIPQPGESGRDHRLNHLFTDLDALSDEAVLQILTRQRAKV